MVLFGLGCGRPGEAAGTWSRWPQAGHGFLRPASLAGDSRGFLQAGQLYLIGGAAGLWSSEASIVLFRREGCGAGAAGGGAAGTCNRCPQAGQGFLTPASMEGASSGAWQRGQLYLIVGPASPSMVLLKAGEDPDGGFPAPWGTT